MEIINRIEIFEKYSKIRKFISHFQNIFFDNEDDEMFDALKFKDNTKNQQLSISLRVSSKNLDEHSKNLTKKIYNLLEFLNTNEVIIISHLKLDFFGNLDNTYSKVVKAYRKPSNYFPEKSFKETIKLNKSEISDFIEILFWLERCDPSIPEYVFWFDKNERFCFYLCKYGNIHIINLTNESLISDEDLISLGFMLDDEDQFSQNQIKGRQIKI